MKKTILVILGLMVFSSPNLMAEKYSGYDNLERLDKLEGKKVEVTMEAIFSGSALLGGKVLGVYESSMTMKVDYAGKNKVSINGNPFFLFVLGDNLVSDVDINDKGVLIAVKKTGVVLAEKKRPTFLRVLSLWMLPKYKTIYVRTDILNKVRESMRKKKK